MSHDVRPANSPAEDALPTEALFNFERTHLERLMLAANVILAEADALPGPLESELTLFKDRVEHALLLPR